MASVEAPTHDHIQVRGLRTARETFNDVVGAIAVVSLRGFSGNTMSIPQDGVRISTSTVVQGDNNNWHYDRIELLMGPASVVYDEGCWPGSSTR